MPIGGGHLHRVDGVLTRLREIEVIVKGGGGVRSQLCGPTLGIVTILQGDGPFRYLYLKLELLWGRSRVGDAHLTTVGNLLEKLIIHKVVQSLVTHVAVARIGAEEVLAEQNLRAFLHRLGDRIRAANGGVRPSRQRHQSPQ